MRISDWSSDVCSSELAGLAKRCQIQLAYAIGIPEPVSVMLDTGGTAAVDEERIAAVRTELVDLRPRGIIRHLAPDRPIYFTTPAYGHFGRSPEAQGALTWERTARVPAPRSGFACPSVLLPWTAP